MSATVQELQRWLASLPDGAEVAVDDGGLTLVVVGHEEVYFELGGVPDGADSDL